MSISTLVIGLGGTGVLTLRNLKRIYDDLPSHEKVAAQFLAIDFDRSAVMSDDGNRLAKLTSEEFLYLQPDKIQQTSKNMDRLIEQTPAWERILEWFPDRNEVEIPVADVEANGAGQYRVLGRLGFFLNDDLIASAIRGALERLQADIDIKRLSKEKRIIIVSSVAGGTGAGMFVDTAYLCRRQEGYPKVYAYLLLPEVFYDVDHGGRIFQNAYAMLREVAHLKTQIIPFHARYYQIPPIEIEPGSEEPFARVYLFGRSTASGGDPITATISQMAETVLAQLHPQIQEKTLAVVNNVSGHGRTHVFSAAGSRHISLAGKEIGADRLLEEVIDILKSDRRMEELYEAGMPAVLAQVQTRVLLKGRPKDEGPPEDVDETKKAIVEGWKQRIQKAASLHAETLIEELRTVVAELKQDSSSRRSREQQIAAGESLKDVGNILLTPWDEEHYEKSLAALKEHTRFEAIDADLEEQIQMLVLKSSERLNAQEVIQRRALYNELWQALPELRADFTKTLPPDIEALKRQWETIGRDLHEIVEKGRLGIRPLKPAYRQNYQVQQSILLQKALDDPKIRPQVEAILIARAHKRLKEMIQQELKSLGESVEKIQRPWLRVRFEQRVAEQKDPLPSQVRQALKGRIRLALPTLVEKVREESLQQDGDPVEPQRIIDLVREELEKDDRLRKAKFMISTESGRTYEDSIVEQLLLCRQEVFLRRTPNPHRRGFAVILLPEGIFWPDGNDKLRSFLKSNTEQILDCRAQIVSYEGNQLWIYFEDLFNPPEHIRNLDDYFEYYQQEAHPEMFHIDRRFLRDSRFKEIVSGSSAFFLHCGNEGCRHNISHVPRTERVCPGCHQLIRSRCGNAECNENTLHTDKRRTEKQCPSCHHFNHAYWWECHKHGKTAVEIPIDKHRCPQCIQRHLADPLLYPAETISRRTDLEMSEPCPKCIQIEAVDPDHETFYVRRDLLPFYRHGVNGHDKERFAELARKYRLPDQARCPQCRTLLIPVHHRKAAADAPPSPTQLRKACS